MHLQHVLLNRLRPQTEIVLLEEQSEFRRRRSTTEQMFKLHCDCRETHTNETIRMHTHLYLDQWQCIGDCNDGLVVVGFED